MLSIALIKKSILADYLPVNFAERIRNGETIHETDTGYYSLSDDITTCANGKIYHNENDRDYYNYDEINDEYIDADDAVCAFGRRGAEVWTHERECVEYRGQYYVTNFLSDNDIVILHNQDLCHLDYACYVESEGEYYHQNDVYYWESDGEYHLDPEPEEEENQESGAIIPTRSPADLYAYGSGPEEKNFTHEDAEAGLPVFGFGCEIEKSKFPEFTFNKLKLYETTGAVMERDSSVSNGFELITPIYNLLSPKTDERIEALREYCNIKGSENAGGHIGFSMEGKTDVELLNLCRGFLPLIYGMHSHRIGNGYCQAKKIKKLIDDRAKYQSIRLRGNYIEFRIFSAVHSFEHLKFRLSFFRIMAGNLGAPFGKVLAMAVNQNNELCRLLLSLKVYQQKDKFTAMIQRAINMDRNFGTGRITENNINKTLDKIETIFKDK